MAGLLDAQPDLAPRSALFELTESLAALMDEMHGEGVDPAAIAALDVSDQSGHWARIQAFLHILRPYFDASADAPDVEARQRLIVEQVAERWQRHPPEHPVIVAGSTGSRGATQMLMRAVAGLPQGAVVLPGFDIDLPASAWAALDDPLHSEDHPQYRFHDFLQQLGLEPYSLQGWTTTPPVNPARNKLISLSLRPAPVTDQWLTEGPDLQQIDAAMADVTLVEAPGPRQEALAIAMRLRQAAQDGETAALITPDRTLTRQVTAALDRWGILPDDSAGVPLHLSPPGRFLRHVGELLRDRLSADRLLSLLKHPLTHQGPGRGGHLLLTRELELHLRRNGPPHPQAEDLRNWAAKRGEDVAPGWAAWLIENFTGQHRVETGSLTELTKAHMALADRIALGHGAVGENHLWRGDDGSEAQKAMAKLLENADAAGPMTATDYTSLLHRVLAGEQVRNALDPHPRILIWGTLEARVHGADLLILAGLNEGIWPEAPTPDPWLNRTLRKQAGLLLPERRIGLSAHDFQQAVSAPKVWLTRSIRSDDAETVASRWLNRLQNLLTGLPGGGEAALRAMRQRGADRLQLVQALEEPGRIDPAPRAAPCPPVAARPKDLAVTDIKRLIRDPYAIYARHVLGLRKLDPLMRLPDAMQRGTVVHRVMEEFIRQTGGTPQVCTAQHLNAVAAEVLAERVPWPEARALWRARVARVADWFIAREAVRRAGATPVELEARGAAMLADPPFKLNATADRIDIDASGNLLIYDYKTGSLPTPAQQKYFDKQLLLEAAIAEMSGFGQLQPGPVARAVYIGLGTKPDEVDAPLDTETPEKIWREFAQLIAAYMDPDKGYVPRRALHDTRDHSDYDQLARFGEWDITDDPVSVKVGR